MIDLGVERCGGKNVGQCLGGGEGSGVNLC